MARLASKPTLHDRQGPAKLPGASLQLCSTLRCFYCGSSIPSLAQLQRLQFRGVRLPLGLPQQRLLHVPMARDAQATGHR